ncbi:polyphosphate kinase 2 family protein [Glacieibacterium frigidum]|uniref:Polyphosphate kinase n=1 Tax=Glacieibacterium frigidum TaxID=2593303 RepID=A0A552UHX1_9SPHN|nr:polyphosphate kinase [Glacieibacterium frigidum]TRW17819.1 polyphosphate kinase [Glacieibacterium frigidum]
MSKLRLRDFEHTPDVKRADYDNRLLALQYRLQLIQAAYITQGLSGIVAVEGWDASGKGGLIKRLTAELDPRFTNVYSIGAPTKDELAHHFLWRFWQRLPAAREIAVFDRTWYGRVLVERVDKLTPKKSWKAAYETIEAFEAEQRANGTRIVKLFLHITQDEQDKRLRERLETPYKRWKTGLDDYHNRSMRDAYTEAYEDMFDRCDSVPWSVIAADDKKTARLTGLEAVIAALGEGVDLSFPEIDPELRRVAEAALGPLNPASTSAGTTTGD